MNLRLLIFLLLLFVFKSSFSQNLPTYAPVSPNAASLGKFGSFPVNTNLGTTGINIPLYTIKQGDIEIPISLSYNATSGIRVNEEASWVGLGWTLNAGGAIVRSVKGQPSISDIPDLGSLDFNQTNYNYMYDVARGWADTAQDEYLFNYSGTSGKFYYDQNKLDFVFTDYKPIKIITGQNVYQDDTPIGYSGYSFKALLANGLQLDFGAQETMEKWANTQLPIYYRQYKSVSYLTKVTSVNQSDNVTFNYDSHLLDNGKEIMADVSTGLQSSVTTLIPIINEAYKLNTKILKQINFKNGYVLFDYSLDRLDSYSPKLNYIKVYSLINGTTNLVKKITFNYDYYNRAGGKTYSTSIPYVAAHHNKSLKLNSVDVFSNNSESQTYAFEYNNTALSIKNSSGQDFWGYSNNNNGSYIHQRDATFYTATQLGSWSWDLGIGSFSSSVGTGNREANEQKSKAGVLTKITYPTGGYTVFEYEANKTIGTETVQTYTSHGYSVFSEGTSTGWGVCDTGLKTQTFSPSSTAYDAKLKILFSEALSGNGNQSYGEFNGQTYFRSGLQSGATSYPATTYNLDLSLNTNTTYTIKSMEYGIDAPGASGCPSVWTNVSWKELSGTTTQTVENLVGGLRIKSITNYDGVSTDFSSRKEFEYSTPQVLVPINNGDYQTLQANGNGGYINTVSSSPGYALNINGGPSIEYLKVTGHDVNNNNEDNGKTIYEYEPIHSDRIITTGAGTGSLFDFFVHPSYHGGSCAGLIIPSTIPYFENVRTHGYGNFSNYYTKSWTSGSLKKQEFYKRNLDNSYTKLRSIENNYNLVDEASLHINYVNAIFPWTSYGVSSGDFNQGNICNFANYTFMYNKGFYSFGKKLLTSTTETQYDENGLNPIIIERTYSYDNPSYFLTEEEVTDSKGDILRTETIYPEDIISPPAPIQKLKNLHRVNEPVETKAFKKIGSDPEKQLSHQKTEYKEWFTDKIFPEKIQTSKGTNVLEDRIQFHSYYTNGNVKEVSKSDGTPIVYIWGYNNQFPIAKIENVTYSQISSYVSDIQNKSDLDDDTCLDSGSCEEKNLRNALNTLRNTSSLSDAMVTTYTYDPLIGVTSVTDPKGYTIYYEYDDFNRLKQVKDAEGNLVSEKKYNYKD